MFAQIRNSDDRSRLADIPDATRRKRSLVTITKTIIVRNYGCFLLVKYDAVWSGAEISIHAEELWDVTSHRRLGQMRIEHFPPEPPSPPSKQPPQFDPTKPYYEIWPNVCRSADKECDVGKWNALIKPYTQDSE